MPEVAWLFPTHVPDFARTARLLTSVREHGLDGTWVPLFSTAADARAFYSTHDVDRGGVHLVVEDVVGSERLRAAVEDRSIVNLKKFAALWDLRRDFSTLHVIDTECLVLRHGSANASVALRRERMAWPAHRHNHPMIRGIQQSSVELFDVRDQRTLMTDVVTEKWLYSWFEDVPTYDADDLEAFFAYFGSTSDVTVLTDALSWETFDFLIYQYFCCLRRGWRLHDTGMPSPEASAAWWELWDADRHAHLSVARPHLAAWAPSWVRDPRTAALSTNAFLSYHEDRV